MANVEGSGKVLPVYGGLGGKAAPLNCRRGLPLYGGLGGKAANGKAANCKATNGKAAPLFCRHGLSLTGHRRDSVAAAFGTPPGGKASNGKAAPLFCRHGLSLDGPSTGLPWRLPLARRRRPLTFAPSCGRLTAQTAHRRRKRRRRCRTHRRTK